MAHKRDVVNHVLFEIATEVANRGPLLLSQSAKARVFTISQLEAFTQS